MRSPASSIRDREGEETELHATLVVGADGRDSQVAKMSEIGEKVLPHARFCYGGYFEGEMPECAPDGTIWLADPQFAAAFPTDHDQVFYAAMPTKDRLPEFKRDPEAALVDYIADFPDAPPIRNGAAGQRRARQDRDAEPGAGGDGAGTGLRRRRGAGDRPAVRDRLRLGVPVRRMVGRRGRAGAAPATSRWHAASSATAAVTPAS